MKTAFIATVGLGTGPDADITKPLIESIRQANPDFLLLFATEQTKDNAETILTALGRAADSSRVHILKSPKEDVELLHKEMLDAVRWVVCDGFLPLQMTADFTTGTKPMSAALVLTASHLGLGNLKYIAVQRDEQKRVCPGTERMLTFKPAGLFASRALKHAYDDVEGYRFSPALSILSSLPESLLSETEQGLRNSLVGVAKAYSAWDLFHHVRFASLHAPISFRADPSLIRFRAAQNTIIAVAELGKAAAAGVLTDTMVVDLLNNAHRRIEEGKYDDATARPYRACELLEQWRLKDKHGINTSDVDLSKTPEKSRKWLEGCRDNSDGKIKVGCARGYFLLAELGDELGPRYAGDSELKSLLKQRNNSILAHGLTPAGKDACEKLATRVESLAKGVIADYDLKASPLRFPWSK